MKKDIEELYAHYDLDTYVILMEDPSRGAVIDKTRDTLMSKLESAERYIDRGDPESLKTAARNLRDATERFCKLVLVGKRKDDGDESALVTDYDGQELGRLSKQVRPLLTKDTAHPGKLKYIRQTLNPGSHDDEVPEHGELQQCLNHLKKLVGRYINN